MKTETMRKVIIIDSCRNCPYMAFFKKNKQYVCMILSADITSFIEDNIICPACKLDDAVIEKKHFNSPNVLSSEGMAICKQLPVQKDLENDSFNKYLIGQEYRFQRQVDGHIRLYHDGIDANKYMLYPAQTFEKYFQINQEASINTVAQEVCPECRRPKKWCECLEGEKL